MGEIPWPLFIYGQAGVGKTCASLCLLDHTGGLYYTARGLCDELIDAQNGRVWDEGPDGGRVFPAVIWSRIGSSFLVVLDEIGCRDRVSDFHYETVKGVLDERNRRPLICLSNLDLTALERLYDDRLASRMGCGTVVRLEGADQRLAI